MKVLCHSRHISESSCRPFRQHNARRHLPVWQSPQQRTLPFELKLFVLTQSRPVRVCEAQRIVLHIAVEVPALWVRWYWSSKAVRTVNRPLAESCTWHDVVEIRFAIAFLFAGENEIFWVESHQQTDIPSAFRGSNPTAMCATVLRPPDAGLLFRRKAVVDADDGSGRKVGLK